MIQTNSYKKEFYSNYNEDREHDDVMDADDYERREYYRNGWNESRYDRQYW